MKNVHLQIQKSQRTSRKVNSKLPIPRYTIVKLLKRKKEREIKKKKKKRGS